LLWGGGNYEGGVAGSIITDKRTVVLIDMLVPTLDAKGEMAAQLGELAIIVDLPIFIGRNC
jgi:hypothetical protein